MWENRRSLSLILASFSVLMAVSMLMPSIAFSAVIAKEALIFSNNIKPAELIFIGTVTNIEYITGKPRPNVRAIGISTDITLKVDLLVKGIPNIDKNTVKFRIDGGRAKHPVTGEEIIQDSDAHYLIVYQLTKGDKALLLLHKNRTIAKWIPEYGGLWPVGPAYGAFLIKQDPKTKEEKVIFFAGKKSHGLELPIPIVLDMMRSAENHPAEVNQLVNDIAKMFFEEKIPNEAVINHITAVLKNLKG